jgi:segregation and condensation protein A
MDYQVDLEAFRGPLDLLLYLVKRDEIDIRDIPIARVAEQFRDYLSVLQFIDVEQAGDFLVMAATLMEIKSRMLLPRAKEEEAEEEDPRLDLVRQLIEYKKFKEAAALLEARADQQSFRLARQPAAPPPGPDPAQQPLRQAELWDLVSAFGRLMRETLSQQAEHIVVDHTPLHVYVDVVIQQLPVGRSLPFSALFTAPHNRGRLVGLFLAVLELIKRGSLAAEQPESFTEIRLTRLADAPAVPDPTGSA